MLTPVAYIRQLDVEQRSEVIFLLLDKLKDDLLVAVVKSMLTNVVILI